MPAFRNLGKTIVLLILIIALVLGGLIWFDYIGVIQAKRVFAPVYKLLGLDVQNGPAATFSSPFEADLDDDRLAKRLEALNVRSEELDKRESDISQLEESNNQIAETLAGRMDSLTEQQDAFNSNKAQYEDKQKNIRKNVANFNSMPPANVVNILLAMDDQDVIDVLRKADEVAAETGAASQGSFWLQSMPPERAAQIMRKMQTKPAPEAEDEIDVNEPL
ncbi:MAG: hypothetical protein Ta2A_13270 [Treponemataceae bacterium]|nr:MAG: hypothetical protein Ta2A_13270 [Treponemataceae bacterium]